MTAFNTTCDRKARTIFLTMLAVAFFGTACKKTVVDQPLTATVASNAGAPTTPYKLYYKSVAQLSLPRGGVVAAAAGNKICFAGGYLPIDGELDATLTPLSRVDIFDATTYQRTTHQLSIPRWGIGAAALGNKIFFAGGESNTGYSNRVDIYDVSNDTWTTATLSQARAGIAVAATGSKVMFAGGINDQIYPGTYYSTVIDMYDVNTGVWSTKSLSIRKECRATATKGDIAIVASPLNTYAPKAQIYHTATNSWTTINLTYYGNTSAYYVPPMFAVAAGSKMLFGFGGNNPISAAVNIVQAGTNTKTQNLINSPRVNAGVCNSGNFAFIAGGVFFDTYYNENPSDIINVYNGGLDAWTISKLHIPVTKVQAATANSTVMFAGLAHATFGYHDVQIYKLANQPPLTPVN